MILQMKLKGEDLLFTELLITFGNFLFLNTVKFSKEHFPKIQIMNRLKSILLGCFKKYDVVLRQRFLEKIEDTLFEKKLKILEMKFKSNLSTSESDSTWITRKDDLKMFSQQEIRDKLIGKHRHFSQTENRSANMKKRADPGCSQSGQVFWTSEELKIFRQIRIKIENKQISLEGIGDLFFKLDHFAVEDAEQLENEHEVIKVVGLNEFSKEIETSRILSTFQPSQIVFFDQNDRIEGLIYQFLSLNSKSKKNDLINIDHIRSEKNQIEKLLFNQTLNQEKSQKALPNSNHLVCQIRRIENLINFGEYHRKYCFTLVKTDREFKELVKLCQQTLKWRKYSESFSLNTFVKVDHRELGSKIPYLLVLQGFTLDICAMKSGDYELINGIAIGNHSQNLTTERKDCQTRDFGVSIESRHLHKQLLKMSQSFAKFYLLIQNFDSISNFYQKILHDFLLKYENLSILWCPDDFSVGKLIFNLTTLE